MKNNIGWTFCVFHRDNRQFTKAQFLIERIEFRSAQIILYSYSHKRFSKGILNPYRIVEFGESPWTFSNFPTIYEFYGGSSP